MKEECLICKAPLVYLEEDEMMECAICRKKEPSKTRCVDGHYVCSDCHTQGMDSIFGLCMAETSRNPLEILEKMMAIKKGAPNRLVIAPTGSAEPLPMDRDRVSAKSNRRLPLMQDTGTVTR